MPNWPMKSSRLRASRLLDWPMVARNSCTSASVRPIPSSWTISVGGEFFSRRHYLQ